MSQTQLAAPAMSKSETFQSIIKSTKKGVFFGGAGVSTASGIPDFRSQDGLYNQEWSFPPEVILSHSFWAENPAEFYKFYREKMIALWAKPNQAHIKVAELEAAGNISAVVTQNIDSLHTFAGSNNVFELHGSVHRNNCVKCGAFYSAEEIMDLPEVPLCTKTNADNGPCGGVIKPDVVLYEEPLNNEVFSGAISAISHADTLIIAGTSLMVYPAASLISYFTGDNLVVINKTPTQADRSADLLITEPVAEVFEF